MLHPLVSLWRHSCRVTFYESGGLAGGPVFSSSGEPGLATPLMVRRRFRSSEEALQFLRYWAGDPGARAELRWMAGRTGASLAHGQGPDAWLEPLAGKLQGGVIVVIEESARRAQPGRLAAPSAAAAAAPAALAALPALSTMPQTPTPLNLLPVLEDIRVEGAEVLPELDQTMEQVQASLASVEAAGASLEPAPAKVGDIQAAMTGAATDSVQALDGA
jgi:hypothetical protein